MKVFGKILLALTVVLTLLNTLIFLGAVIAMLKEQIGFLAYLACFLVAPLLSPVMIALPWFAAWVTDEPVNDRFVAIWGALIVCLILRVITRKWSLDTEA